MVLNGLQERHEHCVVRKGFNPASNFIELRKKLKTYERNYKHRESVDDVDSHVAMTCMKARPKHKSSSQNNWAPETSWGQLTRHC